MSVRLKLVKNFVLTKLQYQKHLTEISLEVALVSTYEVNSYIGEWVYETIVIFAAFKKNNVKSKLYRCVDLKSILCYTNSHHALELVLVIYSLHMLWPSQRSLKELQEVSSLADNNCAYLFIFSLNIIFLEQQL